MPHPLAGLSIAVVIECQPARFLWPLARGFERTWKKHGYACTCARAFLNNDRGEAMPDSVDIVFDPWLHSAFVVYGDKAMMSSGPDPETALRRWFPRAQERGF